MHTPCSFQETLHLLRQARLVLNTNNGFVAGGHERVFTAMCAGAGVVSDQSRYYAEAFKEGREIATFTWSELDKVPGQIEGLLADEAALAAMPGPERKKVEKWASAVRNFLKKNAGGKNSFEKNRGAVDRFMKLLIPKISQSIS